jgi:signal transduction histidine kinase
MVKRGAVVADWEVDNGEPASPATMLDNADSTSAYHLKDVAMREATRHIHSYFLANITHEFRTPLSVLNASVEYLLDEFNQLSRDEIHGLLKSIHLSVIGLQTLIDNLLESTNMEAGRFTIRPGPIKIDDVVAEAIQVMRPFVDRRHQSLSVDKASSLPLVYGDPPRLTQVLVNLLSNASKFGPMGQTINLYIEVTNDSKVRVAVADQGPGIPPEDRVNLFQRFLRLDSPDGAQYGIGLGLSVVKIIVKEHGGEVGVDERPGGGSIFWFTIPLAANEI